MIEFEGMQRRMAKIQETLVKYEIKDLEQAREICLSK